MKREKRKQICIAIGLLAAFALWTALVVMVDVRAIGPLGSSVGLSALNGAFHRLTGVHMSLYVLTDWLSLVPAGFMLGFACLGLVQWIRRGRIALVDCSILMLGGFYAVVMAAYVWFEAFVVNHRPVLIEGVLEASYPSSTTMLVLCVMPTAMMQINRRIRPSALRRCMLWSMEAYTAGMVVLRLVSGVHWLSDIIGGILLSAGLVLLYGACSARE